MNFYFYIMHQLEITNLVGLSRLFMYLPQDDIGNFDYSQGNIELKVFLSDHQLQNPSQDLSQAHEYLLKIGVLSSQGNIFSVSLHSEDNYNENEVLKDETMSCKFSYSSCSIECTGDSGNEYVISII